MNITPEEQFRMYGLLSGSNAIRTLDALTRVENLDDLDPYIREAIAQYPPEDFLQHVIDRLQRLAKETRSHNRQEILSICSDVVEAQMCRSNDGGYAVQELNKVRRALEAS